MKRLVICGILFATFTFFCTAQEKNPIGKEQVAKLNKAGLELFKDITLNDKKGNVFISPFSINSAFGMVYAGAKGETASQISKVLGLPEKQDESNSLMMSLLQYYNKNEKRSVYISNSVWMAKDQTVLPGYATAMSKNFQATPFHEDFAKSAEVAKKMNDFIEKNTNGMLKNMIDSSAIQPDMKMVLLNTLYFSAKWSKKFAKDKTVDDKFNLFGGEKADIRMMYQKDRFKYYADKEVNMHLLSMIYEQGKYELLLIMSQNAESGNAGEKDLAKIIELLPEKFDAWRVAAKYDSVQVWVPKTKITGKLSLGPQLQKLGMKDAFNNKADFSGISGKKDLFISYVLHQTALEMDEESTRAAAATAIAMNRMSLMPDREETKMFRVDRPFIAMILDTTNNNILFVGRITNPTK